MAARDDRRRSACPLRESYPMNDLAADALSGIVTVCFFGTWVVLGMSGFVIFFLWRDAAFKRKWFPRYVILAGVLFVFFSSTLAVLQSRSFSALALLVIVVPMVVLISYLNIKFTKFCVKCGATVIDHNYFSPMRFCSKCGAELTASKHDPVNEF
jgi:hypothetical protein